MDSDQTILLSSDSVSVPNLSAMMQLFSGANITITSELTSALSGTNINFAGTTTEILSGISTYFVESMRTTLQGLSAPIIHPWDALKLTLFEPEHKFPTIKDITVPEEITLENIQDKIKEHTKQYKSRVMDCITNREDYAFIGVFDQVSLISEPSGTDCFAVTDDRLRNYVEALEVMHSIDIDSVTEENCEEYIKKIGYCLTNVLTRKTIKQKN
jgi:hypothetical protein